MRTLRQPFDEESNMRYIHFLTCVICKFPISHMTILLFCNLNTKPVCNTIELPWNLYEKHPTCYFTSWRLHSFVSWPLWDMDLLILCSFWDLTILLQGPLWDKPCWLQAYFETCPFSYNNHYETWPFWDMTFFLQQPLWDMTILRHDIFPTSTIMRHEHFETWHLSYSNHYERWPFRDMVFLQLHNLIWEKNLSTSGAPNNQLSLWGITSLLLWPFWDMITLQNRPFET